MCKMQIKYQGIACLYDPANGWHAENGPVSFGYCETLIELQEEIRDHFDEEDAHYADCEGRIAARDDTPALLPFGRTMEEEHAIYAQSLFDSEGY